MQAMIWLLLVLGQLCFAAASTAFVPGSVGNTGLIPALRDQNVTNIVIQSNYTVHAPSPGGVHPINRNVTITSSSGADAVLDWHFLNTTKFDLCSTCTLSFINISLANVRRDAKIGLDAVQGQPGSKLTMENVYLLMTACERDDESVPVVLATKRSVLFPGKQQLERRDVTFHDKQYTATYGAVDFSIDTRRQLQADRGFLGGYALHLLNTTRLCGQFVPSDCLEQQGADACMQDMIHASVAAQEAAGAGAGKAPTPLAAVMVPLTVGGALAALCGFWWIRRRKQQQEEEQQQQYPPLQQKPEQQPREEQGDVEQGLMDPVWHKSGQSTNAHAAVAAAAATPGDFRLVDRPGWVASGSYTTPLLGQVPDTKIELGMLLGSGSCGRVYLGRWASRQVAVKVAKHDAASLLLVQRECRRMLGFNHPNIVRAYHYVSYARHQDSTATTARSLRLTSAAAGQGSPNTNCVTADNCTGSAGSGSTGDQCATLPAAATAKVEEKLEPKAGDQSEQHQQQQQQADAARQLLQLALTPLEDTSAAAAATTNSHHGNSAAQQHAATSSAALEGSPEQPMAAQRRQQQQQQQEEQVEQQPQQQQQQQQQLKDCIQQSLGQVIPDQHPPVSPAFMATSSAETTAETMIVLEYCDAGTLSSVVGGWMSRQQSGTADDQKLQLQQGHGAADNAMLQLQRLALLYDVACGLEVLHAENVVHGDLNGRNVLVASSAAAPFGLVAKLGDLALSRAMKQQQALRSTNAIGTLSHQPPELLRYGKLSPASDIYSFGVMMWELFTGQVAFKKLRYGQFFDAVVLRNLRPLVPPNMPADYQLLMEHCWASQPSDRPNIGRVRDCLKAMIQERAQQALAAGQGSTVTLKALLAQQNVQTEDQVTPLASASAPRRQSISADNLVAPRSASASAVGRSAPLPPILADNLGRRAKSATAAAVSMRQHRAAAAAVAAAARAGAFEPDAPRSGALGGLDDSWLLQRSTASFTAASFTATATASAPLPNLGASPFVSVAGAPADAWSHPLPDVGDKAPLFVLASVDSQTEQGLEGEAGDYNWVV